jgi:NADH dehydrogenase FAD-containing subunit
MKQDAIVILGGGTSGLHAALLLEKQLGHDLYCPIYVIDRAFEHTYREHKIAFQKLFAGRHIHFLHEEAMKIDLELQQVYTDRRRLHYKDLILAVGKPTGTREVLHKTKGLRHDKHNRVLVDACLQVLDWPRVWAIGDCAASHDSGSVAAALAQAQHVTKAITLTRDGIFAPGYLPLRRKKKVEGLWGLWYNRCSDLWYLASVLPFLQALKLWLFGSEPAKQLRAKKGS